MDGRRTMERRLFVICSGFLFILAMIGPHSLARANDVEAEFKALITELDARWNARDASAMSKLFAANVDFRIYGTRHYRSREEFRLHYEEAFSKRVPADVRHATSLQTIRNLAAGIAVLDGEVIVGKPDAPDSDMRYFYYTALVVKRDGGWEFDTFRVAQKLKSTP
jgi:uncharacterized protein (TIGR02246 family)